jgi:xylulokinase
MNAIGLDVGTSGVKCTLFDENAHILHTSLVEYNIICKREGQYELDPDILREAALSAIRQSIQNFNKSEIKAVCVTSIGESFVCLDEDNNVLCNAMIYMDNRGTDETVEFKKMIGEEKIFNTCGQYLDSMFALYKIRWLQKNNPDILKKTVKICFIADYITYCLGGEHVCDYSLAARSAMFDIRKKCWWKEAVDFAQINPKVLPKPVPSGSIAGKVSKSASDSTGLSEGTLLVIGGHDQILAAVGAGVSENGDIANGMGTVDCMTFIMEESNISARLREFNFAITPYLEQNLYISYAFNMSGGCIVKWFKETFGRDASYSELDKEIPQKPTDLVVIPYLAGGGTPYMDADTPATIFGIRLNTTRGDLFRAFMESESFEMNLNLECIERADIEIKKIITVGGGTNSEAWLQIRSDVFEREIFTTNINEAGTLGSAIMCFVKLGVYPTVKAAQEKLIKITNTYKPEPEKAEIYKIKYQKYSRLYYLLKESNINGF